MGLKMRFSVVALFVLFAANANAQVFDITANGAAPDADSTQALLATWKLACASPSPSKVVVPKGIFKISEAIMEGPCKAPIEFNLQGTLQAPAAGPGFKGGENWIMFATIDHLKVTGTGVFDGQGKTAWGKKCDHKQFCGSLPINVRYNYVTNSVIQDVTTKDSKQFHTNVLGCNNVTFQNFNVVAPEDSVNTDGLHIGRSTDIKVIDSNIQTGDDCISIGDGSKKISITGVTCGPGHGISIGSLGKYNDEEPVEGVTITGCTLKNTQNGVRIKTWPDSYAGVASDMHFSDIEMSGVLYPILIDQKYCPWNACNAKVPSKVKLSKISFKGIRGTATSPVAVNLVCSSAFPCENVELADIDLKYSGPDGAITSSCENVKPTATGVQNPPACVKSI